MRSWVRIRPFDILHFVRDLLLHLLKNSKSGSTASLAPKWSAPLRGYPAAASCNVFLSPSKQSRLGVKIVLTNITNGTTANCQQLLPVDSNVRCSVSSDWLWLPSKQSSESLVFKSVNKTIKVWRWFGLISNHDCNRQTERDLLQTDRILMRS